MADQKICPNCSDNGDGSFSCLGLDDPRCQDPAKNQTATAQGFDTEPADAPAPAVPVTTDQDPAMRTAAPVPVTENAPPNEAVQSAPPAPPIVSDEAWTNATSRWISDHVRNSPIAQSVDAWNYLGTVLHHLRDYLTEEHNKAG